MGSKNLEQLAKWATYVDAIERPVRIDDDVVVTSMPGLAHSLWLGQGIDSTSTLMAESGTGRVECQVSSFTDGCNTGV